MLSIQPLKSAQGAADYYTAAFNYYSGDAQALKWLGKGSEQLGLTGLVEKKQMLDLLEGRLPDCKTLQNKKGEHRPGFDMTFSAPKSVSILSGLGADNMLAQLHDKAVEKAIAHIEKEFAQARVVIDGKVNYINTGNLVVAAFRQPSSRANDPALHTHAVTMNMTFTSGDNKARSLASDINGNFGVIEQLQQHITYAGLLYRTELASLLKEQGYKLRDIGKGMFEIDGMSDEVLKEFSTRRTDIEEKMKQEGWEGAKLASKATLLTRNAKEEHDINVLQADWEKRADLLGFNAHAFVDSHKNANNKSPKSNEFLSFVKEKIFERFYGKKDLSELQAKESVFVGIETLSQQTSVFERRKLKETALKHSLSGKTIVSIEAIDNLIDNQIKNGLIYQAIDPITKRAMLTTPWALTLETETLSRIQANQGVLESISNMHAVTQAQKKYETNSSFPLTSSQKNALMHVFTSNDRFNAIQGYAGTGKTTLLQLTKELANNKGFELRGTAVTSSAVNELRAKAGIHSDVFPIVHQELLDASDSSLGNMLYILDEASMLSTNQGHELIKLIEQKGARLLLTGDDAQLSSVKAGRIFGQLQEYGISTTQMTDIIRQTNNNAREAVSHAINKELYDSLHKLHEVKEFQFHDDRVEAMAEHWLSLPKQIRDKTLMFAPTHANRHDISEIIRDGLKNEGTLRGQEYIIPTLKARVMEEVQHHYTQYYQEGNVLRFNIKLSKSGIRSGDYLTVGTINEKHQKNKTVPLITDSGKSIVLDLKELPYYTPSRAGLNRPIEFYEKSRLALCKDDKVLITRNNNKAGLINSSLASVIAINEQLISFKFENDSEIKTFPLDAKELQHLDHGYVLTNMKVQGKDKMYALGLMESYNKFSATLRNYYVQISRSISEMTLITDDKNKLLEALEFNDDIKISSLNCIDSETLKAHVDKFSNNPKAIDVTTIVDKKNLHENLAKEKQSIIDQYLDAKKGNKTAMASFIAWKIATDDHLKRMARHQLAFSEGVIQQDAIKSATIKLLKGLEAEEKGKVLVIKAYVIACADTQKAWKLFHEGSKSNLQKEKALDKSEHRDKLAFKIAECIEEYKPYLHHFSIGKLNRLGVSQYLIEKGEEKAVARLENLGVHAKKYQLACAVTSFFDEKTSENREARASFLKSQSKAVHPYLIRFSKKTQKSVDELWREINQHAKKHEENIFKEQLSPQGKNFFDKVKQYKALNKELAICFSSTLYSLEKGKDVPESIQKAQRETSALRNEIALTIHNNSSFDKVLSFFKVDKDKIKQQAEKHNNRETVLQFKNSTSNFQNKKDAALNIASDIKGHYPFIKELGINTKTLNTLIRIEERREFINDLNEVQKNDFIKMLEYKITSKKAGRIWQSIFSAKEQNLPINQQKTLQAQQLTAKRDGLAYIICQQSENQDFFTREKLDPNKIEQHAQQHKARLKKINELNQIKTKLFHQLECRMESMTPPEANQWRKSWAGFQSNAQRISNNKALYQEAIKIAQKSPIILTTTEKELLSQYELDDNHQINKPNNPARLKKYTNFYDAANITESLLTNPIETYRVIFGEPKKITPKEMRYSGGLIVSLKGSKAGCWYDFSEGCGGNPISALMRERKISFQDALKEGAAIVGVSGLTNISPTIRTKKLDDITELQEGKNKIISAKSIIQGGKTIQGTIAEKYLKEHRGIENPEKLNILFWPKGAVWKATDDNGLLYEKINKIPALLIAAKNKKGEITGVQRIYLDEKNAKKNTFMENAKLSKGKIEGSAGVLQTGAKRSILYLAEGPETGATIAMANPQATVLVSFGLSNLKNLSALIKNYQPSEVIIAGDNDCSSKNNTLKTTEEAKDVLEKEGINVKIIIPKNLPDREKTDWNDVHRSQGLKEVKNQLGLININHKIHMIAAQLNNDKQANLKNYITAYRNSKNSAMASIPKDAYNINYVHLDKENNSIQKPIDRHDAKEFSWKQKEIDMEI